jgi:hypothetical protein
MHPVLISLIGFTAGALVTALVKLTALENAESEAYRKGYEAAQADQRERNETRARKAVQTRRAKS